MTNTTQHELSILITDDIAQNRIYFMEILREVIPHFTIHEAENGREAVEKVENFIQKQGKSPDLIIMDFRMPVLNGAQATAAIRQVEEKLSCLHPSLIITWSTSMDSPYPQADDWLPKMTNAREVKALLTQYGLLQGS